MKSASSLYELNFLTHELLTSSLAPVAWDCVGAVTREVVDCVELEEVAEVKYVVLELGWLAV